MAYDEGLAERVREQFTGRVKAREKKMFGGLSFMVLDHMCCGIVDDKLMLRVGPDNYDTYLQQANVSKMDFTGKAMKGLIYVSPEGVDADEDLASWLAIAVEYVKSLPPKK
jgi:TfoX/Sxy family transcriptional regulator of competence genes